MSTDTPCPLCDQPMHKPASLYGNWVCQRCAGDFVNRRTQAFLIDYLLFLTVTSVLLAPLPILIFTPSPMTNGPDSLSGLMIMFMADGLKYVFVGSVLFGNDLPVGILPAVLFLTIRCLFIPLLFTLRDGFNGRSLGKKMCDLVVVDQVTRGSISFMQSFKRNLPLLIPLSCLWVFILLSRGFRLGDRLGNTMVVLDFKREDPIFAGSHYCRRCQYDLRSNTTGMCPECGAKIPKAVKDSCDQVREL